MSVPAERASFSPLSGQVHVPPAGETVLEVPLALTVAQQHERPHAAGAYRWLLLDTSDTTM